MTRVLSINDTHVARGPITYVCYGLGSCVALFIADRVTGVTAGAHIPLPAAGSKGELRNAEEMINGLLDQLEEHNCDPLTLRAKLVGGAQVYSGTNDVGRQNSEAVIHMLVMRRIYIAAVDVGGNVSRTARFNSSTGELIVSTSELKTYSI